MAEDTGGGLREPQETMSGLQAPQPLAPSSASAPWVPALSLGPDLSLRPLAAPHPPSELPKSTGGHLLWDGMPWLAQEGPPRDGGRQWLA